MWYCETCRRKNDWPRGTSLVYGPCNLCGNEAGSCYNVPNNVLPKIKEALEALTMPCKPKVIGIVGTRGRDSGLDFKQCLTAFEEICKDDDEIVSGGCPKGGDRFAELIAKRCQVPIKIYYAKWNKLGKKAGYVRNGNIVKDADILIAVVSSDRLGGTEDTIKKAEKKGIKVIIVDS